MIRLVSMVLMALGLLLQAAGVHAQAASPPPSRPPAVLILSGVQYGLPVSDTVTAGAVAALREQGLSVNDIYVENLDLLRSRHPGGRAALARLLRDKLAAANIQLIIAQNQFALEFLADDGYDIVPPEVPVVSTLITQATVAWRGAPRPMLNIINRYDVAGTLRHGLALFPGTRRLILVADGDEDGARFAELVAQVRPTLPAALEIEDTTALPYEDMMARLSALPPDTLVVLSAYFKDRTGRSFVPAEVASAIARRANAPTLALYDIHIRQGLTGGSVVPTAAVGRRAGEIGFQIMSGVRLVAGGGDAVVSAEPMFDWRQLQRWGADPARLPPGAIVLNRPRTLWHDYREASIATAAAMAALLTLVTVLVLKNRRRKQLAAALRASQERLRKESEQALWSRQQELTAARDELQKIFDGATVGMFLCRDRTLVRCNPRAAAMLGYAPQELDGQPVRTLFPSDADYELHGKTLAGQLGRSGSAAMDAEVLRKDGSRLWTHVNATLFDDHDGPMRGMWVAFLEDVSAQHAAGEALLQAKEKAEEASAAKANFLANMSHEIRTPMNVIIGMSRLALQTGLDKKQRNYIEKVHRASENLLRIINDILDFSKIEAGKMAMEEAGFALDEVLENFASLVGMKAEEKGLELIFSIAPDVPTGLVGDALRLGQVLVNLGNNAAKFTEHGEIIVGIEKVADHDDGVELHFWVRDSGIGMTPEQSGRLFESFSQADASTTRKYGGTGLGLVISRKLVERMRGTIWLESVAGQGSTFHFRARFGVQARLASRREAAAGELAGLRMLVVDDNESARNILCTMAQEFGLQVDTAADGAQALALAARADDAARPYDLVLMDWKMPGMDGLETAHRLRRQSPGRAPAIIMVTAYGREEAVTGSAEDRAATTVLAKPVTPSALRAAVAQARGQGSAPDRIREGSPAGDHAGAMLKLKGARVLLVEDNDMNQELAVELLTQAGMTVVLANHGQEALDILARDPRFDGILMDCQMPIMDGYTATREIRRNPAFQDLPIIAMTANAMAGARAQALEAGMSDHIAKPLDVDAMFTTLAQWIHPAGAADDTPRPAAPAGAPEEPGEARESNREPNREPAPAGSPGFFDAVTLPGIDTRFGLATAMHKEDLYRRMLLRFRDGQGAFASLFAQARTGPDPTAAQRCAHTLRGTAGTIGAKRLQAAAEQLEQACQQQAPAARIDALLGDVLDELQPVITGLATLDTGGTDAAAPGPVPVDVDAATLAALRARMLQLLDDGDAGTVDYLEQNEQVFQAAYPDRWQAISSSVKNYDFDAARSLIQQEA